MNEPKQITDPAELVGKTIKATFRGEPLADFHAITFTDGSFVKVESIATHEAMMGVAIDREPATALELYGIDVVTEPEYRALVSQELAAIDAKERRELARLKAKYEGNQDRP